LLLIAGAVVLNELLSTQVGTSPTAAAGTAPPSIGGRLAMYGLITCLGVYLDIVLMRLIGLYYHHFKRRFAWEWE
jgi:hypothetical protein